MAKKIEDRYASMEVLARALDDYLKPVSSAMETVGPRPRRWWMAGAVTAAAVVVVGVALYVNSLPGPEDPNKPEPKPPFLPNVPTGPIVLEGHTGAVSSVAFARGGYVVSASGQTGVCESGDVANRKERDASRSS